MLFFFFPFTTPFPSQVKPFLKNITIIRTRRGENRQRKAKLNSLPQHCPPPLKQAQEFHLQNSFRNIIMSTVQRKLEPPEAGSRMPEKGWRGIPMNPGILYKGKG